MEKVIPFYDRGNAAFSSRDYFTARSLYSQGILCCEELGEAMDRELLKKLYLNRSQCSLNLREYDMVTEDTTLVLSWDAMNCKARLRRAIASESKGDFLHSLEDVKFIISHSEEYSASVVEVAFKHFNRLKELARRDKIVMHKEGCPPTMITKNQVLRLFFVDPIVRKIPVSKPFSVKLCIGNEFGLFDRSHFDGSDTSVFPVAELIPCNVGTHTVRSSSLGLTYIVEPGRVAPNGKITLNLKFECVATIGPRVDEVLMMKFSLSSELPSGAVVKSVYSLPIQVTCNVDALEEVGVSSDNVLLGVGEQLQPTCVRDVSIRGTNFYVFECQASMGIAGKVWDSTYVLLEYLSSHRDLVAGKSIVELGSGTGLAGLAMSTLEPRSLILTDLPDVVPLLSANIQFNALQLGSPLGTLIRESFSCRPHGWGNMDEIEGLRGEVVVASDVVYDPVGYQPLVDSLQALLAPVQGRPAPICILAHRHRHPEDSRFFSLLSAVSDLRVEEQEYHVTFSDALQDVKIFHIYYHH